MDYQLLDEVVHRRFNGVAVGWRRESRYSHLCGFGHKGAKLVLKIPVPRTAASLAENERRSLGKRLNSMTSFFLDGLLDCGVLLARDYVVDIDRYGYGLHVSRDEGMNCEEQLSSSSVAPETIFMRMIRCIRGVLTQKEFVVGLDGRLENFAGDEARYVDVFPPLVKIGEKYHVHHPNPTDPEVLKVEMERKFTAFGILRRIRFDVLCADPVLEPIFLGAIRGELPEMIGRTLIEQFASLPDREIVRQSPQTILDYLAQLEPDEVEARREVAARIIPKDAKRRQRLFDVFTWTSSTIQKSPEEFRERLNRFEVLIREILLG